MGAARTPEDRLATLRKSYPDARPYGGDNFAFTDPRDGREVAYNPSGLDIGDVASVGPEITEFGGGVVGAAAAIPPAVAGAIPTAGQSLWMVPLGAGLGAAAGREIYDLGAKTALGTVDTRSLPTRVMDASVTTGVNMAGQRLGDVAGEVINRGFAATNRALPPLRGGRPAIRDANRAGMPSIPAGMATGSPTIQHMEQWLAATPGGYPVIRESIERAMAELGEGHASLAQSFNQGRRVLTPQGAGKNLQQAADDAGQRFAAKRQEIDDQLTEAIGGIKGDRRVPIDSIFKLYTDLTDQLARAPNSRKAEFQRAIDELDSLLADAKAYPPDAVNGVTPMSLTKNALPFDVIRKVRTRIGRELEDPDVSGYRPGDQGPMAQVYGALSDDVKAAAEWLRPHDNGRAANLLRSHDRFVKAHRTTGLPELQRITKAQTPEQAFDLVWNAAQDGGTMLGRIRGQVTREEWDNVAATVLQRMGAAKPGQQGASEAFGSADDFSPETFLTNFSKLAPEAKKALFGGTRYRELIPELESLVRTAGRARDAAKIRNTSRTAPVMVPAIAALTGGGAMGSQLLQGDVQGAGTAALGTIGAAVVAPRYAAKLLTSPGFVRWLSGTVQSTARHPDNWPARIGQLTAIVQAEPQIREEVYQYLDALRAPPSAQRP